VALPTGSWGVELRRFVALQHTDQRTTNTIATRACSVANTLTCGTTQVDVALPRCSWGVERAQFVCACVLRSACTHDVKTRVGPEASTAVAPQHRLHCTMRLAAAFHCDAHALHDKHARTQHTELGTDERRGQRKLAGFSHSPTAVRNADTVVQRLACSWAMSTHLWQWCCSPFRTCTACGNPFCTTALGSCVANSCTRCGCACAADEAQRQC
jgi:hypothetical protein